MAKGPKWRIEQALEEMGDLQTRLNAELVATGEVRTAAANLAAIEAELSDRLNDELDPADWWKGDCRPRVFDP